MKNLTEQEKQLIQELNEVRESQKSIKDFNSINEWVKHCQDIAAKKAIIFEKMEKVTQS